MANSLKTDLVTNSDSVPVVLNDVGKSGGTVRVQMSTVEWDHTTLAVVGDFMRLCRLPTNARLVDFRVWNDDLDTTGGTATLRIDFGIYPTNSDLPVDQVCINPYCMHLRTATEEDGIAVLTDLAGNIDNTGITLWELAGLASDPGGLYDICMTIENAAATLATGTVAFVVQYTID